MTTAPFSVCAVFGERRRQLSALRYASDLARVLGADQLHVYLPGAAMAADKWPAIADRPAPTESRSQRRQGAEEPSQPERMTSGGGEATKPTERTRIQTQRVVCFVAELSGGVPVVVHDGIDLATCAPDQLPPNPIIVSSELAMRRSDVNILQPFEEVSVRRTQQHSGHLLVPFGDGEAGPVAATLALPLARALGLAVVFYHTTWPAAGVTSTNPVDHIYSASRAQYDRLAAMARAASVQHRMEVEMADDVVMGMLGCALNGGISPDRPSPVSLIVMSHGVNTCIGSYVEKTLNRASTPVLVVASPRTAEGGTQ